MPFQPTTQLEAVNIILATIGEAPVNTLSAPMTSDASLALACLNEHTKAVQTEGYPWNVDTNVTLTCDASGNLFLASNTANVEINRRRYPNIEPVVRATSSGTQQLYDRRNQTNSFAAYGSLVADRITYWLDWTALPEAARRYILIKASRVFADRSVGAETTHQFTEEDERNAKRSMDAVRVDMDSMNILNSPSTLSSLYRGGMSGRLIF